MKFSIERDTFTRMIKTVDSVCAKGATTFVILRGCLIEATGDSITITGTDLDCTLKIMCKANVIEEGKVVIFEEKKLLDTLLALDSGIDVMVISESSNIRVESGKFKSRIPTADLTEYPVISDFDVSDAISMESLVLKDLIDKTSFSISKDTTRVDFTGALVTLSQNGLIQMVSTDGRRLSRIEADIDIREKLPDSFEKGIIVPGKGLVELSRNLTGGVVNLSCEQNKFVVKGDNFIFCINLIAGQFPDFSKVIPQHPHKAIVSRDELSKLIKKAGVYAPPKTSNVRITIQPGSIQICTAVDQDGASMEAECECEYDGEPVMAGFNYHYIDDVLKVIGCDVVSFEVIDMDSPAVIRDVASNRLDYVIMPMQL